MFRSKFVLPAVAATLLVASQGLIPRSLYAAPMHANPDVKALKAGKPVKMSLTNSSPETLQLMVGETAMTVAPNATVEVRAAEGAKIVNVETTRTHAAGELIAQVSKALSGTTIRIR